ncbi:MAG: response regulator [Ktedonobacterales bacterium]
MYGQALSSQAVSYAYRGNPRSPARRTSGVQDALRPDADTESSESAADSKDRVAPFPVHRDEASTVILVAENEVNNRRLIEHILAVAGYRYVSATNGLEVLRILDTCQVDAILLDLSMPLLDGYQTTEQVRRRPDGASLPIVAVTAYAMSEDRERALRSGCTDYLAKPFRASQLLEVVRRVLSSR